jgi:hypothetical protein
MTAAPFDQSTAEQAELSRNICLTAAMLIATAPVELSELSFADGPMYVTVDRTWLATLAAEIEQAEPGILQESRDVLGAIDTAEHLTAGVYFIRAGDAVKIGMSGDVRTRIRTLRTMSPVPIELIGVIPGGREVEADLHRMWANLRLHGEWFRAAPILLSHIEDLRRTATFAQIAATGELQ